jgi:hypothetical protein
VQTKRFSMIVMLLPSCRKSHACLYKHTSSLGIVSNVPSAVIRINSPVFLRGVVGSVHFYWNEVHYRTACVHCRNLCKEKKLTESVLKSFGVNIQPHEFPQSHVYVSLWKSGGPQIQFVKWRGNRREMCELKKIFRVFRHDYRSVLENHYDA